MKLLVSIIILTYNSQRHLPALFTSLAKQTYQPLEIIVVDNASHDTTVLWIQEQTILKIKHLIANTTNDWYCKGNNAGIAVATGEYILFCNDDVTLEPNFVERLVQTMQTDETIGMVGGKLLRLTKRDSYPILDTAGLTMYRSRRVVNRGENEVDQGQYNTTEEVFGISGAVMMVSKKAITLVQHNNQFFDEDFIAYKDDVDVSWRMRLAGFKIMYVHNAVGYHARSIQHGTLDQRLVKPEIIRGYSYRNHLWTVIKNETGKTFFSACPWIIVYELSKFLYLLVREPSTLRYLSQVFKKWHSMRAKHIHPAMNYSLQPWIQ